MADATWVAENLPEDVDIKRRVFAELDATAPADAILASSTSAIVASRFTAELAGPRALPRRASGQSAAPRARRRAVRRTVDIAGTLAQADAIMRDVGQVPVLVRREIDGFILNRLQGALLSEAMRLVGEGTFHRRTSTAPWPTASACAGRSWVRSPPSS